MENNTCNSVQITAPMGNYLRLSNSKSKINKMGKTLLAPLVVTGLLGSPLVQSSTLISDDIDSTQIGFISSSDYKTRTLKSLVYWIFKGIPTQDQNNNDEYTSRYSVDIPFVGMSLVITNQDDKVHMAIVDKVYEHSSKIAYAWADEKIKKKTAKYEADFEAKELARQSAAAQHALLASARYNELSHKAYQMGLAVHNRLVNIEQTVTTPIYQRDAYKAGVKIGRASYKLDVITSGVVTPVSESKEFLSGKALIEADKLSGQNDLKFAN